MGAFRTSRESVGLLGIPRKQTLDLSQPLTTQVPGSVGDESGRHYSAKDVAIATIWLTLLVLIIGIPAFTTALSGAFDIVANR